MKEKNVAAGVTLLILGAALLVFAYPQYHHWLTMLNLFGGEHCMLMMQTYLVLSIWGVISAVSGAVILIYEFRRGIEVKETKEKK